MEASFPRILHETKEFLVVDKPPGWLTIPGREPGEDSVIGWLRSGAYPEAMIVHRIDRETSGLLLFARSPEFHRLANAWFERHEIQKVYQALALGAPGVPAFQMRSPIEGKRAVSQVSVLEIFGPAFLAEVRILTGRRHQIRIHFRQEKHPLLGDTEYGGPAVLEGGPSFPRVALHAFELHLPTGEKFQAPLPADFEAWLKRLREKRERQG